MTEESFINILIAEDNEISREMMVGAMRTQGYKTFPAAHADAAIDIVRAHDIDLALVDINMAPKGGFEFVKYLVIRGIDLPVVIITADNSSDVLMEANALGVKRVIHKPVEPEKLIQIVQRILERRGLNPQPFAVTAVETKYNPDELMQKAIALAERNAKLKKGGPFGAVLASRDGKILGEGANGITSRADPTAHAEVMAIRQAAERLNRTDLSDCVLYCSSAPTMMGQALIISVGIKTVYYGISHEEISSIRAADNVVRRELGGAQKTEYIQLGHDRALAMFQDWKRLKSKILD